LARNLATPYLGREPKARVATADIQNELDAIKIGPKMYDDPYNNKILPLI
jgi:hypothetical protein